MEKIRLFILILFSYSYGQPIVDTEYGKVQGRLLTNVFNGEFYADVNAFHGIPYAKSTEGARRFSYPEKRDPWAPEIFAALELGQACPQSQGGLLDFTHPGFDNYGEDCLNLDIYTPTTPGPYPVMVWFHGGAYQTGTSIQYPGHFLATRNVVVVAANYRLAYFGFAYTGNDACPGNFGLFDQKMALEFVRDNIANFSGDPDRVTVFGQSAGAGSTGLHVVSPHSQGQGLFHQAIMESGTELNFWAVNPPESHPEDYIRQIAEKANCTDGMDDYEMMDCLREIPWDILRKINFDCTPGWYCLGMVPVVDRVFLPDMPEVLREAGSFLRGPIITGITLDDGSFYTMTMIPESVFGGFNHSEWLHHLAKDLLKYWAPLFDNETYMDVVRALEYNYSPWPYIDDEYQNRHQFNMMITDAAFGSPWDKQMKKHSEYENTYGYVYGYRGRNSSNLIPEWMGVPHMGELPQVWGWTLLQYNDEVRNDSGILNDIIAWTEEDIQQTIYFNKLYANFAHTGNPTPVPVEDPLGNFTTWTPFSAEDMAYLFVSNTTVEIRKEYRQKDFAYWRHYMPYIIKAVTEDPEGKRDTLLIYYR